MWKEFALKKEFDAPGHPPGWQHVVGARGLVAVCDGGALAQKQRPVVAEVVVIPGVLHSLDLQVLRSVPVISRSTVTILFTDTSALNWPVAQPGRLLSAVYQHDFSWEKIVTKYSRKIFISDRSLAKTWWLESRPPRPCRHSAWTRAPAPACLPPLPIWTHHHHHHHFQFHHPNDIWPPGGGDQPGGGGGAVLCLTHQVSGYNQGVSRIISDYPDLCRSGNLSFKNSLAHICTK